MRLLDQKEQRIIYTDLLVFLHDFCEKNGLSYFLAYGTLLGAVRHKGFIPWDDDVDVFMPRKDYEKLLEIFDNDKSERYKVYHYSNNDSIHSRMIYIIDSYTQRKSDYALSFVERLGMNIDIFPIDNVPDSNFKRTIHRRRVAFINNLFSVKAIPISPYRSRFKNFVLKFIQSLLSPISFKWLAKRLDKVCSKYVDMDTKQCNCFFSPYDQKKSFDAVDFAEAIECQFEEKLFLIPKGYHSILAKTYGNYMELPPEEKRLPHNDHMEYYFDESREKTR